MSIHNVIYDYFDDNEYFVCRNESIKNPIIYVANIENEYWMSLYEITLISKYKPKYNKGDLYKSNTFLTIPKLNWIPYICEEDARNIYFLKTKKMPNMDMLKTPIKRWELLNLIKNGGESQ